MKTADFDYDLPPELIAQTPVEPRDASRLLVLHRQTGTIEHRHFRDIVDYLRPGDLLIGNDSRVIPARLHARKVPTGGKVELLLVAKKGNLRWEALVKGRRVPVGAQLQVTNGTGVPTGLRGDVIALTPAGGRLVRFDQPLEPLLDQIGVVPLPPYIYQPLADPERYQTVYAQVKGSSAAPTAGLHFTPELMLDLRERGVRIAFVTLHISLDTFRPVSAEHLDDHRMYTEWCELSSHVAEQINATKLSGQRIVAVGTTVVRVLETAALKAGEGAREGCPWQTVAAFSGPTDLFIYPGFRFRVVDTLMTNFHLPRSTLLMLVSAFAGKELIDRAYKEAIEQRYRFYSFGDANLIL